MGTQKKPKSSGEVLIAIEQTENTAFTGDTAEELLRSITEADEWTYDQIMSEFSFFKAVPIRVKVKPPSLVIIGSEDNT